MAFIDAKDIFLRGILPSDIDGPYFDWLNDFQVTKFLESRFFPNTKASMRNFLESVSEQKSLFLAICLKDGGKHIGNIKLGPIDPIHRRAEMGIMIGDKLEYGKGYASQAIQSLAKFGFEELNLNKIWAGMYSENVASLKAFEKAGFVQEATLKKHFFSEGLWTDCFIVAKYQRP